jgi:hypothetical protein
LAEIRLRNARKLHPGYENLAKDVESNLRTRFAGYGHSPSDEHWRGIREIIRTIEMMALGVSVPMYYLSSLPTGMGKTSTLVEATKELIRIGEKTGDPVGILILTNTLDQIPVLIEAMGLREDQYAVRTGKRNVDLNSRGVGEDKEDGEGRHSNAQVLFTTQQKLHALTSMGLPFDIMYGFTFRNRPRQIRIWDEAILPAKGRVLSADDIDRLKSPLLRAGYKEQRDALEVLTSEMKARTHGDSIEVPAIQLPDPKAYAGLYDERDFWVVDALVRMAEGRANIRQDSYAGTVALYYEEILPDGFAPLLILDASGSLRLTYTMWKAGRGNLEFLKSPGKTYRNLKIRHWDHGAGKTAHRRTKSRRELAEGVAEAVAEATPDEPILIIVRLSEKPSADMAKEIRGAVERRMAVEGRQAPELRFLTWGRHLATNDYANVKHVIVVGLLQYSATQAEAMARGSAGLEDKEALSDNAIDTFHKGEIAHHVFQGVGRGAVRKAIDGDVPPGCKLDIIFPTKGNGASVSVGRDILQKAFPGAKIAGWDPVPSPLSGNETKLVRELARIAASSPEGGFATMKQLADIVGIVPVNIWQTLERPHVIAELARRGIGQERRQGNRRGTHFYRSAPLRLPAEILDRLTVAEAKQSDRVQRRHRRHLHKKQHLL